MNVDCRQVEDDLETMWQVASSDNRQMRDNLRKLAHQLQAHQGLAQVVQDGLHKDDVIEEVLYS